MAEDAHLGRGVALARHDGVQDEVEIEWARDVDGDQFAQRSDPLIDGNLRADVRDFLLFGRGQIALFENGSGGVYRRQFFVQR